MPLIPSPLKAVLAGAAEAIANRYLALDQGIAERLAPMNGKVIAIRIQPYEETLYLCPNRNGVQVLESIGGAPDATLEGSFSALTLMGLSATPMRALYRGDVRLSGDVKLARQLQQLLATLDVNPEAQLAQLTGAPAAQKLFGLWRQSRAWSAYTLEALREDVREYVQEETRELPSAAEAEIFFEQIDDCRNDYDRLLARVQRLNTHLSRNQGQDQQTDTDS